MKFPRLQSISVFALGFGLCVAACDRDDQSATTHTTSAAAPAADNTKINTRDQSGGSSANLPTPTDQSNDLVDLSVTQRIRRALLADDSLSVNAKNVKVITATGVVTLRGPVKSDAERAVIASKARDLAGDNRVDDQLEVAPTNNGGSK